MKETMSPMMVGTVTRSAPITLASRAISSGWVEITMPPTAEVI